LLRLVECFFHSGGVPYLRPAVRDHWKIAARGMSRGDAARRIARQMPREERLRYADYVIDNSGDLGAAEAETKRVFGALQGDLAARR